MDTVVGIFATRAEAEKAIDNLRNAGIPEKRISFLTPGNAEQKIAGVPTEDAEQPGLGTAVGGVVGGALGAAGGMTLGAAVATVLVPGVGAVFAMGLLGAAIFGAGGTAGGMAIGESLEENLTEGVAADELFLYEDALRQKRSVVIVFPDSEAVEETSRKIMQEAGAESIDAARERWWIGLRDAEKEHYSTKDHDSSKDEAKYRRGFEAAVHRDARGKRYEDMSPYFSERYPDVYNDEVFRRGYDRGQTYDRNLKAKYKASQSK
jgi:hypothetical protein